MNFMLNEKKFDILASLRGWRSKYSDVALATGMTRSYVRRVFLGEERMTDLFMLRYIRVAGANIEKPAEWGSLFRIELNDDPMMSLNHFKQRAQVPYEPLSLSYDFRKKDDPRVEEKPLFPVK